MRIPERFHIKPKSLAIGILKGIAVTGIILLATTNPQFGHSLLKAWERSRKRKNWKEVRKSLKHLEERGFVTIELLKDGNYKVVITKKGNKLIKQINIETLQIHKPEKWDKIWRVVIFDVPNIASQRRHAFSDRLKSLGFAMIQKSVWVYPYKCHEEIMILRNWYGIDSHVTYLETRMVEDDNYWKTKFKL